MCVHACTHTRDLAWIDACGQGVWSPMICPGEPVLCLSLSLKAWERDKSVVRVWVLGQEKPMFQLSSQVERQTPLFPVLFYLGLQWIDDAHPHWGGLSALLSPLIQMLTSSKNTLMHTQIQKIITPHMTDESNRAYSLSDRWGLPSVQVGVKALRENGLPREKVC